VAFNEDTQRLPLGLTIYDVGLDLRDSGRDRRIAEHLFHQYGYPLRGDAPDVAAIDAQFEVLDAGCVAELIRPYRKRDHRHSRSHALAHGAGPSGSDHEICARQHVGLRQTAKDADVGRQPGPLVRLGEAGACDHELPPGPRTERVDDRIEVMAQVLDHPRVVAKLEEHGFTIDDLNEGMELLYALVRLRLGRATPAVEAPKLLAALDAWENRWFPVVRMVLAHRYPRVAEVLFLNLRQAAGAEVALTMQTFLERFAEMEAGGAAYGAEGVEARALLAHRGLTAERVAEAQALLARLREVQAAPVMPNVNNEQAAERALWNWYLEWSGIARAAIRDKRLLRSLGFRKTARGVEEVKLASGDQPVEVITSSGTVAALAGPAPLMLAPESSPSSAG
jgi:hypothetical protein